MRPLHPLRWIAGPMLLAILATWLLTVPLKVFSLQLPEPIWALAPLFAWAVIRPSILAPFAVLALGVAMDILWGGALGPVVANNTLYTVNDNGQLTAWR